MNFEDFQKAWQSQGTGVKMTINADALLKEVRRNQQQFRATIFWRDVREVGVAVILTGLFLYWAIRDRDWSMYLLAFACFGIGTFMLADRWRQRGRKPVANDPLRACIEASLIQVKHQIWLLKNVFWWYLLPLAAALGVSTIADLWHSRHVVSVVLGGGVYALFVVLLYWGIYWLNQFVVRKNLEPRRQELEALAASLSEHSQPAHQI